MIDLLKTSPFTHKIKDLNRENIGRSFYEKKLLLKKLMISHYPEPNSHIRDEVKVVLDLLNYTIKKELNDATSVYIFHLGIIRDFVAFNKLVNVPSGLNNLKTKVDGLDVYNLKSVPVDL